jgi:hypothetical protein
MLSLILAAVLAAPTRSPADFAILQGKTLILTRAKNAVAIVVDTNFDGYADELFWFYSVNAPALRVFSEKSSVEYSGDELVVTSADTGETYVFSVGRPRVVVRMRDNAPSSASYEGYGLSHKMGAYLSALRISATNTPGRLQAEGYVRVLDCNSDPDGCILYPDDGGGGGGGAQSCDSGGVGSSSCSISGSDSSCSVSCVSGYYSCCTKTCLVGCVVSCKCVKL